jgi:glycosyltransferase involved in cell wall biosynthesis
MKVALYYPWIYLTSGSERVIVELARRSRHEWKLITSHYEPQNTFPELRQMHVSELRTVSVRRDVISTACSAATILRQRLPIDDCDALFVLSEGLGDFILFRNHRKPSLCYCLTPLRAAFDPVYRDQAFRKRGLLGRLALSAGLALFAAVDRLAWRRYTRVLFLSREAVSRAGQAHLLTNRPPDVLYPGMGLSADRPSDRQDPFFLIAGRIMWTKNVQLGIHAFQSFTAAHPAARQARLVIAGIVDTKSVAYLEKLRSLTAADPRIEFRIAPSDAELRRLYEECFALLFPPLNEDFGLVPIEAMAFGKPVIAVNRGGPLETIQHGVQGFLEEPTPEAFANRMADLYFHPPRAREMGRMGFQRARLFSWEHFVGRIDDELEAIAGKKPAAPFAEAADREVRMA